MLSNPSARQVRFAAAPRLGLAVALAWASSGAWVGALCGGCQESVELGTECAPLGAGQGCALVHEGGEISIVRPNQGGPSNSSVAAGAPRDAGLVQPVDAELVGDAGAGDVAIRSNPLVIQNPSFERNGGVGGDVLLEKLISLFPVVNLIFAELPDWYACFPLSVSSLTWLLDGDAGAQQSPTGDYLSFVINGTSVRQQLAAPLVPGTAYAFEFDVISESGGGQNLYLEARGAAALCGNGVVLGRSPVVRDGADWSTSCVSFTADDAYSYLLLAPNYEGNAPGLTARLRVDGLRQVERCP